MERMIGSVDEGSLRSCYKEACKDEGFKKLVKKLGVKEDVAMKYTSKLENTVLELKNCSECKGLGFCKNEVEGYVNLPTSKSNKIVFSLAACKYLKEVTEMVGEENKVGMKDIALDDKRRVPVVKWMKAFLEAVDKREAKKGLYLYGNFGCGKTFLIRALFSELEKRRRSCEVVYFPELLRDLKSDFDTFGDKIEYYQNVDYLLLDDMGAESSTAWSRDEVLGTILQYRMNEGKVTFFTSNLSLEQLERHLADSKNDIDVVKARRILERIKYLAEPMELLGEDRRV